MSPFGEMNDPEHPLRPARRTEAGRVFSSQASDGWKRYFSFTSRFGKSERSHIPSSADAGPEAMERSRERATIRFMDAEYTAGGRRRQAGAESLPMSSWARCHA